MSCLMRKSHVSRENLMSQENISYLIIFGPLHEKISCLLSHEKISGPKRKSHVFSVFGPPPTRKSPVSCLMRKSRVPRENLMSQEKISYPISFGPSPKRKSPVSCLMRKSH